MKNKIICKNNSGITLIALIILIIIILILAGASLYNLSRSNGILARSKTAKTATEEAQLRELVLEKYYECQKVYTNSDLSDTRMKSLFEQKISQIDSSLALVVVNPSGPNTEYKVTYKGEDLVVIP